ncbi:MAG: hypothetical protein ACREDE_06330, partial [Thermoplasmata archaeon]
GKGISIMFPTQPTQTAARGNAALLSEVETISDSIGYSDLTDVLTASTPVQYAAIENPRGEFIVPTIASSASAIADKAAATTFPPTTGSWYNVSMVNADGPGDYPLATFAYLFVYRAVDQGFEPSLQKAQVIVQWLDWTLTTGQTYSNSGDLYYVPLPPAVIAIDNTGIQSMTFNGESIPSCN